MYKTLALWKYHHLKTYSVSQFEQDDEVETQQLREDCNSLMLSCRQVYLEICGLLKHLTVLKLLSGGPWETEASSTWLRTASDKTIARINNFEIRTEVARDGPPVYDDDKCIGCPIELAADLIVRVHFPENIEAVPVAQPVYQVHVESMDRVPRHSMRNLSWDDVTTGLEILTAELESGRTGEVWARKQKMLKAVHKILMERKGAWKHSLR